MNLFSTPKSPTPPVETPEQIKAKASEDNLANNRALQDIAYWRKMRVGRNQLVNTGIYIPN